MSKSERCTLTLGHGGPHKHNRKQQRGFLHGQDCGEPVSSYERKQEAEA